MNEPGWEMATVAHSVGASPLATDAGLRALLGLAAAIAAGQEDALAAASRLAVAARLPAAWVDELLLQSVLMVGWPRALVAAAVWRQESGVGPDPATLEGEAALEAWVAQGVQTCRVIYGSAYERLRENVRQLHPLLDEWMVTDGYGKVLSRPGLDLGRRELCTVAQLAVLDAPRQLYSHIRGAVHAGASAEVVEAALEAAEPHSTPEAVASARATWGELQRSRSAT